MLLQPGLQPGAMFRSLIMGTERNGGATSYYTELAPTLLPWHGAGCIASNPPVRPSVRPTVCLAAAAAAPFPKPDKGASYSFEARMQKGT